MYPRNATSPEPIAIGAVVQISDGAVQTSGVTVRIKPVGVAEGNGAGTTAYSTDGVVLYTPTQSETNYTSFVLIASKAGCFPASQTVITSESTTAGRVYVATNGDKTGYSLTAGTGLGNQTANITGNLSGSVGSVTGNVVGSVGSISGVTFPTHFQDLEIAANGHVSAAVVSLANNSITASSIQGGAITAAKFASGAIDANALAADAVAEIRTGLGLASANLDTQLAGIQSDTNDIQSTLTTLTGYVDTEVAAIKSVTDKLNTGLVADGAVFQFTANMLELAPQASGGGSATIENQELILGELDTLRNSFAAAVGRLAVASQITGFPAALVRNSDYSIVTESEIRLSLNDLDGNPITEIGGVQCSEIEWLFGLGSERAPAIIEGAATWDDANNQLVIQIDADDTEATPLGTLSWQIGCTIDTTTRYLGGGTTRLIERQF